MVRGLLKPLSRIPKGFSLSERDPSERGKLIMKTRLILNPSAGAGRARERLKGLRPQLEENFGPIDWQESQSPQHITELAEDAALKGYEQVLVAGGDGTVHFAINGLAGHSTALGILPVGTGNDVAASLGIPQELNAALSILINKNKRAFDLCEVHAVHQETKSLERRYYCCVLGLGMDTPALKRIQRARYLRRGRLLYSLAALRTILSYRGPTLSITTHQSQESREVFFAAICNTRSYAGGMTIAPAATIDDGLLDLCVVPQLRRDRLLRCFSKVFEGRHVDHRQIIYRQSPSVKIDSTDPVPITLDGELTPLTSPVEVRVRSDSLTVYGAPACSHSSLENSPLRKQKENSLLSRTP